MKLNNTPIKLSLITSLVLMTLNASNTIGTVNDWNKYPIPQEITSKSRGGLLADKEAIEDGLGAIIIKSINTNTITVDNSTYNKILLENKDKIDTTNGLKELVINNNITIDSSKLDLINNTGLINPNAGKPIENGTLCDDNNNQTINDVYTNNVCLGTSVPNGTSCNDNNSLTINETWLNGICQGGESIVGKTCNDNNSQTINDVYNASGICIGENDNLKTTLSCTNRSSGINYGGSMNTYHSSELGGNGLCKISISNLTNNFYIELVSISANYNSIGLAPTAYSSPYFYGNADKIGIYYNHNSKKASICNTNSCGVISVSSNLPITIGSGSPSENGSFQWVLESNIDQNLKNNAINQAR